MLWRVFNATRSLKALSLEHQNNPLDAAADEKTYAQRKQGDVEGKSYGRSPLLANILSHESTPARYSNLEANAPEIPMPPMESRSMTFRVSFDSSQSLINQPIDVMLSGCRAKSLPSPNLGRQNPSPPRISASAHLSGNIPSASQASSLVLLNNTGFDDAESV